MDKIRFQRRQRRTIARAPRHGLDDVLRWLSSTAPPLVLDVRAADEHDRWSVPGSVSIPADDILAGEAPDLPFDRMIVVVSRNGRCATEVAARLRSTGRQAGILEGGMATWSRAWNTAHRRLHDLDVVQIRRPADGRMGYLVARRGEAMAVDPCVAPEVFLEQAQALHARIGSVMETGVDPDSSAADLARLAGAPLLGPHHVRLSQDDTLPIGGHILDAGEQQCIDLGEAILTGTTIRLHPDAGAAQGAVGILRDLDPKVHILPGQADGPPGFDGAVIEAPLHQVRRWHAAA